MREFYHKCINITLDGKIIRPNGLFLSFKCNDKQYQKHFMIVYFGTKTHNTRVIETTLYCPVCERETPTDLLQVSHYFHVFWIPCFPTEMENVTFCHNCAMKRTGVDTEKFKHSKDYETIKRVKHPLFTYAGAAFTGIPIIVFICSMLIDWLKHP
ncbi:MAG: zinc-ribbon domain-containing protein [Bacteroidetes bacterium]|nr:MAG: zinc-ribbon domain-containing protein [Bacteroidota bacterium]